MGQLAKAMRLSFRSHAPKSRAQHCAIDPRKRGRMARRSHLSRLRLGRDSGDVSPRPGIGSSVNAVCYHVCRIVRPRQVRTESGGLFHGGRDHRGLSRYAFQRTAASYRGVLTCMGAHAAASFWKRRCLRLNKGYARFLGRSSRRHRRMNPAVRRLQCCGESLCIVRRTTKGHASGTLHKEI